MNHIQKALAQADKGKYGTGPAYFERYLLKTFAKWQEGGPLMVTDGESGVIVISDDALWVSKNMTGEISEGVRYGSVSESGQSASFLRFRIDGLEPGYGPDDE